jgi:hypothetical protein
VRNLAWKWKCQRFLISTSFIWAIPSFTFRPYVRYLDFTFDNRGLQFPKTTKVNSSCRPRLPRPVRIPPSFCSRWIRVQANRCRDDKPENFQRPNRRCNDFMSFGCGHNNLNNIYPHGGYLVFRNLTFFFFSLTPFFQTEPTYLELPNNMIWQLHQGLFVQDQQHHSTPSQLYFTPNEPWPSASTLSSLPSPHWPASSQCGIMQVVSTLSQNSAQLETSAQTNNCSLKSSIPNLTFESSSSQTRPSPFGTCNHSAPAHEAQPEGYLPQPRYALCRWTWL